MKNLYKFKFSTKINFNLLEYPYANEINFSSQYPFFIDLAKSNFDVFKSSKEINDPNIGDQMCQLRCIWYLEMLKKNNDLDLVNLGKSIVINRSLSYDVNDFGLMDKYTDISKKDFEDLVQLKFSNNRRVKYYVNLKSAFSRYVNEFVAKKIIPKLGYNNLLLSNILNHFSNKIFFTQKHERIPFIPFYTTGLVFIDYLMQFKIKTYILYRQFIVEDDMIYLNGYRYIEFKDGALSLVDNEKFPMIDQNAIVIEAYSCYFKDKISEKFKPSFYKNLDFSKVLDQMVKEINFRDYLLSNFAFHDKYHQQPFVLSNSKVMKYEFEDIIPELNDQINKYIEMAQINGLGVNKWFPYKGDFLNDEIAFNLYHIYPKNISMFNEDFKSNIKFLHKKFYLKRKAISCPELIANVVNFY